jgi:hypothetical protein
MWSVSRRVVASAVVTALASSLAVASAATADPLDPVYAATLSLSDGAMWCSDWPVLEDSSWTVGDGRGPAWDTFRVTSSVANIDGSLSADDYRIIFTIGDEALDGVGYHVDGSHGAPGVPRPDGDDGAVRAEWYLPMSAPLPNQIGVKLIGLNEDSQWVEVYQGSIPVINGCLPPTQQVGAPDELVLGDAIAGRGVYVDAPYRLGYVFTTWGGQTAGRWVCACDLTFDVSVSVDGVETYATTSHQPAGLTLPLPADSAGKAAVVTIKATPTGVGDYDAFWTPVTITSAPVVIGAPPSLTGNLHLFTADPGWNVGWGSQVLCAPLLTPVVGYQLWASPWHGKYAKNGPEVDCMPMLDLSSDNASTAQSNVTWYDGDGHPIGSGNPLTVTADMCGDVITAKQTWGHPAFTAAQISGTADYPVFCIQHMTPVPPTVTGTPKVGSPLSVDLAGWLPASTSFAYQWYWELDSSGTNAPIPGATGATFTPTPAQAGHRVWVDIEASASGYYGESLLSDPITIPVSAPSAPRSLKATSANKAVKLTWTAPSGDGGKAITGYRVQRSTNGTAWTTITTTTSRSYTATGLTNGKKYWLRVVAVNSVGSSAASAAVTAIPFTKASAPRSLKATAKTKSVALSWAAPSSNGGAAISGYRIYRSTNGKTFTLAKTVTTRSTTVTGLTKGKKYWFKVVAVNKAGSSPASKTVTARPK